MPTPVPPRYVPTLTEVVAPAPQAAPAVDRDALVESVMASLAPEIEAQIEAQLRRSAAELLEIHLREVLPVLQMHIEAAVRRALDHALADEAFRRDVEHP